MIATRQSRDFTASRRAILADRRTIAPHRSKLLSNWRKKGCSPTALVFQCGERHGREPNLATARVVVAPFLRSWRPAMRKMFPLLAVTVVFSGLTLAFAAEEVTITGDAVCAKCALKEQPKCQNTITTEEGGKKVTYYLTQNAVSKKAHGALKICPATKDAPVKVKAVGTVKEENGKKILTASKIEAAD
jgi:hypothetical protein